jgi:site-specific DNA-methyltransferase (adenine-specific)
MNPVHYSSATDNWATPRDLLARLSAEFGPFDLDVCADVMNAAAERYFTRSDDGLTRAWSAQCCWMNPPYGRGISLWIEKAHASVMTGDCQRVVCLLPARTDTRWWQRFVVGAALVRFLPGRLRFGAAKTGAPFPSAVVVFDITARPSLSRLLDTSMGRNDTTDE